MDRRKGGRCPGYPGYCFWPNCRCTWPTFWQQAQPWLVFGVAALAIYGLMLLWR